MSKVNRYSKLLDKLYGIFFFILILSLSCGNKASVQIKKAPDFMLEDVAGKRFYLNAYKGRVVLLNFWSVYCVPCQKEMPELNKLFREYDTGEIVFAGICTDKGQDEYIAEFTDRLELAYTQLIDLNGRVAASYKARILPSTYIIDRKGYVRYSAVGYTAESIPAYRKIIDELL